VERVGLQVQRDQLEREVHQDLLDNLDLQDRWVLKENLESVVLLVNVVQTDGLDRQAHLDHQAQQGREEKMVLLDLVESQVPVDLQGHQDLVDLAEKLEVLEHPAAEAKQAHLVLPDLQGQRDL